MMDGLQRQVDSRRRFLRAIGAKSAVTDGWQPNNLGRHYFGGRRSGEGRFVVFEVWADILDLPERLFELIGNGWRVAVLDRRFSTRDKGRRRPVVLVPPGSRVDPRSFRTALEVAGFQGIDADE
jgi:hypothetical protein